MLLDPTTVYVLGVIFVATLIRSTLGFGEALVAVPLLALRTPIAVARAIVAILIGRALNHRLRGDGFFARFMWGWS